MKGIYARLLVRGYQRDLLITAFTKGILGKHTFIKRRSVWWCVLNQENATKSCVFFHLTYHLRHTTSKDLQIQWRQQFLHTSREHSLWTLKNKTNNSIGIKSMSVAYSWSKNIGNIFTYHKVNRIDRFPISSYMYYKLGARYFLQWFWERDIKRKREGEIDR